MSRLSTIRSLHDPQLCRILEIGALNNPTYRRPAYRVEYVDFATREDLARRGAGNPRYAYEGLVDVDYVVPEGRYAEIIGEQFDLVVANHVAEHIPDLIGWLDDLGRLLTPSGAIFLSVPDKRYTFDLLRREADCFDLIHAHVNGQKKPNFANILEHFWCTRPVKTSDIWNDAHHADLEKRRFTAQQAVDTSIRFSRADYADVHCHAYTHRGFDALCQDLRGFGLLGFQDVRTFEPESGSNEFHVVLSAFDPALGKNVGALNPTA